jgi:glycolate oxidase iron-sulfur subunit
MPRVSETSAPSSAAPARAPSGFRGPDRPRDVDYLHCVHCGLCLNQCPTYRLWGKEADSPRGRIRQMILVDEGRLGLGESFVQHIDRCLDCRACETACPSGVEYGKLVEAARAQIELNYRRPLPSRIARSLVYRHLLPYPRRIAAVARIALIYQHSGLQFLARKSGLLDLLGLQDRDKLLPAIEKEFFFSRLGRTFGARGKSRARVALFAGCISQVSFAALHEATIRVLTANGCEVVVPEGQLCCGALPAHAGVRDIARRLGRINVKAFSQEDFDAVLTNAAGCGSTLKEYPELLGADDPLHGQAVEFSARVRDVTEFLDELGMVAPLNEIQLHVTYQDSCHLAHGQKVREAPRRLIRSVPGVEFTEMRLSDNCCGSAGVYNVTQTQASMQLLAEKMQCARESGASAIVTANPGCLLQLRAGAEIHKTGQQVLHVIELLDRALQPGV